MKHAPRALGELLARLPNGAQQFEQIAAVLVAAEATAGSKPHGGARLRSNLWVAGNSAFIVWPPRAAAEQPADSPLSLWTSALEHESFRKKIRRLVSLVPSPLPGAACSQEEHDQAVAAVRSALRHLERIEVWDEGEITRRLLGLAPLALRYLPEEVPDGHARLKRLDGTRQAYDTELAKLYGKIQFIGMSVYKEEAAASVSLERIYIPLRVIPEGTVDDPATVPGTNPLALLIPGDRQVILGDPAPASRHCSNSLRWRELILSSGSATVPSRTGDSPSWSPCAAMPTGSKRTLT